MAETIVMPNMGLTNTEGTIIEWLKRDGDAVNAGEHVVEIATDKVTTELEAPVAGILKIVHPNEAVVPIAEVIGYVLVSGEELPEADAWEPAGESAAEPATRPADAPAAPAALAAPAAGAPTDAPTREVKLSPAAKRVARELGLGDEQIRKCQGTGPGGRITSEDLMRAAATGTVAAPTPAVAPGPEAEIIPLAGTRGIIAERMARSTREAPQFHLEAEIMMARLMGVRDTLASKGELKPSYTELIVKGIALALKDYPLLNCFVSDKELTVPGHINIGVAVAAESGLIVPVVRDVDGKNISAVCREVRAMVQRARAGALNAADLADGTFTFSNLGMLGVDRFSAILNPPQATILTMGRVRQIWLPVEGGGAFRPVAAFTLTVDHRAVDGAMAARFMGRLAQVLDGHEIEELCGC